MRLLDLFCGEGGASTGYAHAGFTVVGVDSAPMPRYPFEFIQASALDLPLEFLQSFDAIAASPPCKVHTRMKAFSSASHVDLVAPTRDVLEQSGKPYIIENVPGAPLRNPLILCGSMFGRDIRRHRLFESNIPLVAPSECRHAEQAATSPGYKVSRYHSGQPKTYLSPVVSVYGRGNAYGLGETQLWRDIMAMPWASKDGLREAIPPYYTAFLGAQLLAAIFDQLPLVSAAA